MEKELKDMTKEEVDALIHEYYENHQRLWIEISNLLNKEIKKCKKKKYYHFCYEGEPEIRRKAMKKIKRHFKIERTPSSSCCFAYGLAEKINVTHSCSKGCPLKFRNSVVTCLSENSPYRDLIRCIFMLRCEKDVAINLKLARDAAIEIANLPLREFDYENLCFK